VRISASGQAQPGDYQITITGTAPNGKGGSVSKTTSYTLTVGGRCEGELKECTNDSECRDEQHGDKFYCEGARAGSCDPSDPPYCQAPSACYKNADCAFAKKEECTCNTTERVCDSSCSNSGAPCRNDKDCYKCGQSECKNGQVGYCARRDGGVTCRNNSDCPLNQDCMCDYGPCENGVCKKSPNIGCESNEDCKWQCP